MNEPWIFEFKFKFFIYIYLSYCLLDIANSIMVMRSNYTRCLSMQKRRYIFPGRHHWFDMRCAHIKNLNMVFNSNIILVCFYCIFLQTSRKFKQKYWHCKGGFRSTATPKTKCNNRWRFSLLTLGTWQASTIIVNKSFLWKLMLKNKRELRYLVKIHFHNMSLSSYFARKYMLCV